jgi:hypothetical protein
MAAKLFETVTTGNDASGQRTTFNAGWFGVLVSVVAATGTFGNFLVNLVAHLNK